MPFSIAGIPMPVAPQQAFSSGFSSMDDFMKNIRQAALERQKLEEHKREFEEQMKLHKAAAGRASQASSDARELHHLQLQKLKNDLEIQRDPMGYYTKMMSQMNGQQGGGGAMPQEPEAGRHFSSYMPSIGQMPQAPQMESFIPQIPQVDEGLQSFIPGMPKSDGIQSFIPQVPQQQQGLQSFIPSQELGKQSFIPEAPQQEDILQSFVPKKPDYEALKSFMAEIPKIKQDQIEPGNIDLRSRPRVKNDDGSISTVLSMGIEEDGKHILIPRVSDDGKVLSPDEAIKQYHDSGQHLGVFASKKASDDYARLLHLQQANEYAGGQGSLQQQMPQMPEQGRIPQAGVPDYVDAPPQQAPEPTMGGMKLKDIVEQIALKKLGVKPPSARSSGGVSSEDRALDRQLKRDQLSENAMHHRELEKANNLANKVKFEKEKSDIKAEKDYKSTINKEEAKIYTGMQEQAIKGFQGKDSLNGLTSVVNSPAFEEVSKHPYMKSYSLAYYKNSGTKAQKQAAADLELYGSRVIGAMAKDLNTRFTNMDLELANQMKITSGDSYEAALQKARSLNFLAEMSQTRLDKSLDLIKSDRGLSPYEAMRKADQNINGDKIRQRISNSILSNQERKGLSASSSMKTGAAQGIERETVMDGKRYYMINGEWHDEDH